MEALAATAAALVAPPKGILAADESAATMSARLASAGAAPTRENRRAHREMLIAAPGLSTGISGVILSDETLRQRVSDGRLFPAAIREAGLIAGIRVDTGAQPLPGAPSETIAEGLDGLPARLRAYRRLGAAFATWRAVLRIGPGTPSPVAVRANAQALGRYAAACQEAGLVPIVAPEIGSGGPHSQAACETVTSLLLLEVMSELRDYRVDLAAVVLAPSMTLAGRQSGLRSSAAEIAAASVRTLEGVPLPVAGVAFLGHGQRPERATENLAAIQSGPHFWPLTFCFGAALDGPALTAWRGEPDQLEQGQRALAHRVRMNVAALDGRYTRELDLDPA
ncbi:MAG TPA: class I fructose-bisphosphate aldolase [Streptosporangiaceae bacterium]|nr:class I fructose-bisphosphate aldolase [Streptosporangiaceae bacterium]